MLRQLALLGALGLAACSVLPGKSHVALATNHVRGAHADTIPPEVKLAIESRFQGFVSPTYPGGAQVPAVVVWGEEDGAGTQVLVAVGEAAEVFAGVEPGSRPVVLPPPVVGPGTSSLTAQSAQWGPSLLSDAASGPTWFATDRTLGLHLEFAGPGEVPLPQSALLGYRYKQLYLSPVTVIAQPDGSVTVTAASALAAYGLPTADGRRVDVFATGSAASGILNSRESMIRWLLPAPEEPPATPR